MGLVIFEFDFMIFWNLVFSMWFLGKDGCFYLLVFWVSLGKDGGVIGRWGRVV